MIRASVAAACLLAASTSRADEPTEFLPREARAIPRTDSASRDAPVFEYAYGPRAQATIGFENGLVAWDAPAGRMRLGDYALVASENAANDTFFPPKECWRAIFGLSIALALRDDRDRTLELGLSLGHESDFVTSSTPLDPVTPYDIPFGGGGNFLDLDVGVRLPVGQFVTFVSRLGDRAYFNTIVGVFTKEGSDLTADALREGLAHAPFAEAMVRVRPVSWFQPYLAAYGESLLPHDDSARRGAFFRALLAAAFVGSAGELAPFVSADVGNGKGALVNRRERRLSFGVRYAP